MKRTFPFENPVYAIDLLTAAIGQPFFGHKLPAARELFKPFTDSASLLVDIEKKHFSFSVGFFWRWPHNEGGF